MARKKNGFWTEEKLDQLEQVFHLKTKQQLIKMFGKPYEVIVVAYDHRIACKTMLLRVDHIIINGAPHPVKVFAPSIGLDGWRPMIMPA